MIENSWVFSSGTGQVKVEEHAGRIAGLYVDEDLPNLLWQGTATPALGARIEGGDRMWLAPQWDVFEWDGKDVSSMNLPSGMDPGSWQMNLNGQQVKLEQTFLDTKMIRLISPLGSEVIQTNLPFTGYEIKDQVITKQRLSSWHLLMVPHPADIFVHSAHSPVNYLGTPPTLTDQWVTAETGTEAWKIGLSPGKDGKIAIGAFSRKNPGGLVVILSSADPSGTYIDYPPGGFEGTAVQIYNSAKGGFCEIEHHAPLETKSLQAYVLGFWGDMNERISTFKSLVNNNPVI